MQQAIAAVASIAAARSGATSAIDWPRPCTCVDTLLERAGEHLDDAQQPVDLGAQRERLCVGSRLAARARRRALASPPIAGPGRPEQAGGAFVAGPRSGRAARSSASAAAAYPVRARASAAAASSASAAVSSAPAAAAQRWLARRAPSVWAASARVRGAALAARGVLVGGGAHERVAEADVVVGELDQLVGLGGREIVRA